MGRKGHASAQVCRFLLIHMELQRRKGSKLCTVLQHARPGFAIAPVARYPQTPGPYFQSVLTGPQMLLLDSWLYDIVRVFATLCIVTMTLISPTSVPLFVSAMSSTPPPTHVPRRSTPAGQTCCCRWSLLSSVCRGRGRLRGRLASFQVQRKIQDALRPHVFFLHQEVNHRSALAAATPKLNRRHRNKP